jgi:transposase
MSLLELFCHVDDFWMQFGAGWEQELLETGQRQRRRASQLSASEMMTIMVYFHQMRYRDFKTYYTQFVQVYLCSEFPKLVSYNRFVELMPSVLVPLCAYLQSCYGSCTGINFIDSTPVAVCHNRRIGQHRVFAHVAQRGKNSVDWFYGFKLHLVVNDRGEILACRLTPGNVDDRTPVPRLVKRLWGKLFGDKGYLSQPLTDQLRAQGIHLVTRLKSKMKNRLMPLADKLLLRKRSILETITDQLKNISQIEHTRHRSLANLMVNLLSGLIAYSQQPKKPFLALDLPQLEVLIPN